MRVWGCIGVILLMACSNQQAEEKTVSSTDTVNTAKPNQVPSPDTATKPAEDTTTEIVRKPSGVYQFLLPADNNTTILHTIAFYPTTFRLQEEYPGKKDSLVITEGTWTPSQGAIWLYKEQIVRGRYNWSGNTLQYYSPRWKKSFSLSKLTPVSTNPVWQTKKKEGVQLYAVGNEPFWSVAVTRNNSITISMPGWKEPLQAKPAGSSKTPDSTIYTLPGDSVRLTVYPQFCSDGMSDFIYTRKVKLTIKGQTYRGCGEVF